MSREWERALERQLALLDWFDTKSAALWVDILRNTSPGLGIGAGSISEVLGLAETFYVSTDILKLVEVAAGSIGDPVLERHVPFTKSGFAYFQKPLRAWSAVRETEGELMRPVQLDISAVAWAVAPIDYASVEERKAGKSLPGEGITFLLFGIDSQLDAYAEWLVDPSGVAAKADALIEEFRVRGSELQAQVDGLMARVDRKDEPGWEGVTAEEEQRLRQEIQGLQMAMSVSRAQVEDLELVKAEGADAFAQKILEVIWSFGIKEFQRSPMDLIDVHAWGFGTSWSTSDLREEVFASPDSGARAVAESVGEVRRFMFALWSLMAQPIAAPSSERPGRAYRRRWEQRVKTAPNYGDVRVVTLRRAVGGGGGDEADDDFGPEWSHRWVVRGHWRKQWYASEGVHRLVWISPFVKGPEDKPLIVKDRVFEVVR